MKKQDQIISLILGLLGTSVALVFLAVFMLFSSISNNVGNNFSGSLSTQLIAGGYDNNGVDLDLEVQSRSVSPSSSTLTEASDDPVDSSVEVDPTESSETAPYPGQVSYPTDDYLTYRGDPGVTQDLPADEAVTTTATTTMTDASAPDSGPAETVILIFAIVLGLLGSAIFLAIKLRGYH